MTAPVTNMPPLNNIGELAAEYSTPSPSREYVPSADQLLFLFGEASKAHDSVAKNVGGKMQDAINAKNGMSGISNELQLLKFDENGGADGKAVIEKIEALQKTVKDPQVQAALADAHKIAVGGPTADISDTRITKDEMSKIDNIVSDTINTVDSAMSKQTMALKQENDYFTSITAIIKEIMDSNTKVFNTVMGRG